VKLDDFFELGYCINLDKRLDRWEVCDQEFYKLNYYPERFSAIEHQNPATGCRLSHLAILKQALKENKNVLVMEDDIQIINFEDHLVEKVLDELWGLDWAMIYFGANLMRPCFQVSDHLARLTHAQSTHFYGISKRYLPQIINVIENNDYFIDCLYADVIVPQLPCYISIPMVAVQRSDFSDIEKMNMNYDVPLARYNQHLIRTKRK
jgi:GR25 family glycosyltransferase involved in LPS biosynthesis